MPLPSHGLPWEPRTDPRVDPRLDPRLDPRDARLDPRDARLDPRLDPRDPRLDPYLGYPSLHRVGHLPGRRHRAAYPQYGEYGELVAAMEEPAPPLHSPRREDRQVTGHHWESIYASHPT